MKHANELETMEFLLLPLQEVFGNLARPKVAHYCTALNGFTVESLKRGFVEIRDTYRMKGFPSIADCVAACRKVAGQGVVGEASHGQEWPHEGLARQRRDALLKWEENYRQTPLCQQAYREGWGYELINYARAVAWVQVQILHTHADNRIALNGGDIWASRYNELKDSEVKAWIAEQRRVIAQFEQIAPSIDAQTIDRCRTESKWRTRSAAFQRGHVSQALAKAAA